MTLKIDALQLDEYLNKILPQPSNTINADRFNSGLAGCNGNCKSEGGCMTVGS